MSVNMALGAAEGAAALPGNALARRLDRLVETDGNGGSPSAGLLLERALTLVAEAEQMLADQRARIQQLEQLSMTDELTGLYNRRGFLAQLARELANGRRHGAPGVLVLADLDGLKQINDTLGHVAGDAAIRRFADLIDADLRRGDIVARLGGDEFAMVLHKATAAGAAKRVAQIRRTVETTPLLWNGAPVPLAASFGRTVLTTEDDETTAMARADDALYADKRSRKARDASLRRRA
ncbi:MAG: diguanylate cyclase [Alphaproteobacteria bacterium]|jgi:diguanylate cyclase (GGDEF)-like protein|nr:diguanylate cyclase [Alphaproteobacteria bacterium]